MKRDEAAALEQLLGLVRAGGLLEQPSGPPAEVAEVDLALLGRFREPLGETEGLVDDRRAGAGVQNLTIGRLWHQARARQAGHGAGHARPDAASGTPTTHRRPEPAAQGADA